jgi:hypothetical protein
VQVFIMNKLNFLKWLSVIPLLDLYRLALIRYVTNQQRIIHQLVLTGRSSLAVHQLGRVFIFLEGISIIISELLR